MLRADRLPAMNADDTVEQAVVMHVFIKLKVEAQVKLPYFVFWKGTNIDFELELNKKN